MKEDIFEVLMYLFQHHMKNDCRLNLTEEVLATELERVGFSIDSIDKAFDWLEGLLILQENTSEHSRQGTSSLRLYSTEECFHLEVHVRGFLLSLEKKVF